MDLGIALKQISRGDLRWALVLSATEISAKKKFSSTTRVPQIGYTRLLIRTTFVLVCLADGVIKDVISLR